MTAFYQCFGDYAAYRQKAFSLSFQDYIQYAQTFIRDIREKAGLPHDDKTIDLNSPFELRPANYDGKKAVLLIHGFLASPYIMRALGEFYLSHGFLVRAIILPGHGASPGELNGITHQDWIAAARYGIESLKTEASECHVTGFSLGATLASLLAYEYEVKSLALFAPAHGISRMALLLPVLTALSQYKGLSKLAWLVRAPQNDLFTYKSYSAYSANEVRKAITLLIKRLRTSPLTLPCFVAATADDGTVNATDTIRFFKRHANDKSKMLLYSSKALGFSDKRIEVISGKVGKSILAISHVAMIIPPSDPYYGLGGRLHGVLSDDIIYGEYSIKHAFNKRFRRLTYHPGFDAILNQLANFYSIPNKTP